MKANKEAKLHLSKVALSVVTELEGTLLGYLVESLQVHWQLLAVIPFSAYEVPFWKATFIILLYAS